MIDSRGDLNHKIVLIEFKLSKIELSKKPHKLLIKIEIWQSQTLELCATQSIKNYEKNLIFHFDFRVKFFFCRREILIKAWNKNDFSFKLIYKSLKEILVIFNQWIVDIVINSIRSKCSAKNTVFFLVVIKQTIREKRTIRPNFVTQ